jgi:hypothetical protein
MTLPQQEHNSLLATREFLKLLLDEVKYPNLPEKIRLSAKSLLEYYPDRLKLDKLYEGQTFETAKSIEDIVEHNPNKIVNDNQTWQTPGYKWKTEVEYVKVN